jgi:hypothetical protein
MEETKRKIQLSIDKQDTIKKGHKDEDQIKQFIRKEERKMKTWKKIKNSITNVLLSQY